MLLLGRFRRIDFLDPEAPDQHEPAAAGQLVDCTPDSHFEAEQEGSLARPVRERQAAHEPAEVGIPAVAEVPDQKGISASVLVEGKHQRPLRYCIWTSATQLSLCVAVEVDVVAIGFVAAHKACDLVVVQAGTTC